MRIGSFHVALKFVPRDLWVGVYAAAPTYELRPLRGQVWPAVTYHRVSRLYVCLLPCLPLVVTTTRVWQNQY